MTLSRREALGQLVIGAAAFTPALVPSPIQAIAVKPKSFHPKSKAPRVHTSSTITHVPVHHTPVHHHIHKHHKYKHHHRHPHHKAHNARAQRTLSTPGDRHDMALTMWGEARGYGELGMRCIGHVIMNRVAWDHHATGHGIHGVCHKRKQFSCWNKFDNNYKRMLELGNLDEHNPDWVAFVVADKLAGEILSGADKDNTGGATFYFAAEIVTPYWLKDMDLIGVQFGHTFCKPKKRPPHIPKHLSHHHRHQLVQQHRHH